LAAGNRARLSRADVRILVGRTGPPDFGNKDLGILAKSFCRTARSRSLDRIAGEQKCARCDNVRAQAGKAARAEAILPRCRDRWNVRAQSFYFAAWVERG